MDTIDFKLGFEKENIYMVIILTVILSILIIGFYRYTYKIGSKNYIKLYQSIVLDTIKYIFIEGFIILFESIEQEKINIFNSIARISSVHLGILLYYTIKESILNIL